MSEVVWQAAIAGAVTVILAYFQYQLQRTLDKVAKVGRETHTLVNSNMGVQLHLNAVVTRRLADLTRDPQDEAAATLASRLHAEHVAKQAVVDASSSGGS